MGPPAGWVQTQPTPADKAFRIASRSREIPREPAAGFLHQTPIIVPLTTSWTNQSFSMAGAESTNG
jgi:hypothetical protein